VDSLRAVLKYLWPVMASNGNAARVYYYPVCPPGGTSSPLSFPKVDVQPPSGEGAVLGLVQEIFRRDRNVVVMQDRTGMVRVSIGEPADAILQTRIPALSLDADAQYNVIPAITAVQTAPAVQLAMRALKVNIHGRWAIFPVTSPLPKYPHMPGAILDVTMDQALDMIARTWGHGGHRLLRVLRPAGDIRGLLHRQVLKATDTGGQLPGNMGIRAIHFVTGGRCWRNGRSREPQHLRRCQRVKGHKSGKVPH
jgi:hypothetical protein